MSPTCDQEERPLVGQVKPLRVPGGHWRWRISASSTPGGLVIYRALLLNILERANARAYGHAARYLERLQQMAGIDLAPLFSHEDFVAQLRSKHGRKTAFWSLVGGA